MRFFVYSSPFSILVSGKLTPTPKGWKCDPCGFPFWMFRAEWGNA